MSDHQVYREWSAAYVLGALDAPERAEFAIHLETCDACQSEVARFAALPGLLARLDDSTLPPAPDRIADAAVLTASEQLVGIVRSRSRWRLAAVAILLAFTGVVGVLVAGPVPEDFAVLALDDGSIAVGEVRLQEKQWGTAVDIQLTQLPSRDRYVAWVISTDGTWEQVATWGPTPAARANVMGASSVVTEAVATVVVTATDRSDTIATAHVSDG